MNENVISISKAANKSKPEKVHCRHCGCQVGTKHFDKDTKVVCYLGDNGHVDAATNAWICCCGHSVEDEFA